MDDSISIQNLAHTMLFVFLKIRPLKVEMYKNPMRILREVIFIHTFSLLELNLKSLFSTFQRLRNNIYLHLEGDNSWVFIGRTDGEAETPILWPPHAKS